MGDTVDITLLAIKSEAESTDDPKEAKEKLARIEALTNGLLNHIKIRRGE